MKLKKIWNLNILTYKTKRTQKRLSKSKQLKNLFKPEDKEYVYVRENFASFETNDKSVNYS